MPMYVLVVPLIWLMAQAPAAALALGVVADVARVPVGLVATALLVWREYHAPREWLVAGAILLVASLLVGNSTILMLLGGIYLLATFVAWYRARHSVRAMATSEHAEAPAR